MDTKNLILWIVIAMLAIAVVYVVFFKTNSSTAAAVSNGKLDTTGWTENEKMNYEMHGTIPARVAGSASGASGGSGMVGGC